MDMLHSLSSRESKPEYGMLELAIVFTNASKLKSKIVLSLKPSP
jgi:hypothetical protein